VTWSRIDDQFALHPKVLAAGNAAVGLWVRCLTQCSALKTDGLVPAALAAVLGSPEEIASLTAAGLWEPVTQGQTVQVTGRRDSGRRKLADVATTVRADGYWITDYLHYHRTKAEIDAGGREGSAQSARADVRTSSAQSARADVCHPVRGDARAISHPIPSQVHPPSVRPSASTSVPVPLAVPAEAGGRAGGEPPVAMSPNGASDDDGPADGSPEQVDMVLDAWGWGSRLPDRLGLCRELIAQGITMQDLTVVSRMARQQGKDPAALGMTWLQSGAWRDVVADHERATPRRNDGDVPGPMYGEPMNQKAIR
jgi:hypothetical protein